MIEQNQNIILLILILISVLVAFYALYIGLNNSRKIKKQQQELINIINLNKESIVNQIPEHPVPQDPNLDEFPTLDEINKEVGSLEPLDEDIKAQIDSLENNEEDNDADSEEVEFENIEIENEEVEGKDDHIEVEGKDDHIEDDHIEDDHIEVEGEDDVEEDDVEEDDVEEDEGEGDEDVDGAEVKGEDEDIEEVKDFQKVNLNVETYKYLKLVDITEEYLNELNCDDLREISRRENLRLRGRKNELVDRILKKKTCT